MMLHYSIIAVPARRAAANALAERFNAEVYLDDPPSGSARASYARALRNSFGDWHILMEDDAAPVADFEQIVGRVLPTCGGPVATFFCGDVGMMTRAREHGATWLRTPRAINGLCFAVWSAYAKSLADEIASAPAAYVPADRLVLRWLLRHGGANFTTVPSLVEHRQDMAAVIDPRSRQPRAAMLLDGPEPTWTARTWADPMDPEEMARTLDAEIEASR